MSAPLPLSEKNSRSVISRRGLFKAACRSTYGLAALSLVGVAWGSEVEPDWVDISRFDVELPHLPRAFDGFQLVQISDIHIDRGQSSKAVAQFSRIVAGMNVDAVLITGDFFTDYPSPTAIRDLKTALEPLRAKEGIWGIVGNHDVGVDEPKRGEASRKAVREIGIRLLDNEVHVFERGNDKLYLAGVDDLLLGSPDVEGVAAQIPENGACILMGHEPDYAPAIAKVGKFGLMLSGHSHGGQVCLPFIGPLVLPYGGQNYPRGWYDFPTGKDDGTMRLYTNRGLGTVGPKVRLLCRPEITVFTLRVPANT